MFFRFFTTPTNNYRYFVSTLRFHREEIKSIKRHSSRHVQLTLTLHFNHKNNSFDNFIAVLCHKRNSMMQFSNIHAFFLDQNPAINDYFPITQSFFYIINQTFPRISEYIKRTSKRKLILFTQQSLLITHQILINAIVYI